MARTAQNPRVVNRSGRTKLAVRRDPYWHLIAEGQHLGYRRNELGGTWIARCYSRDHGRRFQSLGNADDTAPANGTHVLSFQQALEAAQTWLASVARADASGLHVGPYTIADAASEWLSRWRGSERSKATSEANVRYRILPVLGSTEVRKLTRRQVEAWLHDLATKPPIKVERRLAAPKTLSPSRRSKIAYDPSDPETQRKRKDTANRVFNDLRALLTHAYEHQRADSKAAWETVAKFEGVDAPKNEYLSTDEASRFIRSCPPDFRDLVHLALISGCRYGELCDLRVAAFIQRDKTITVMQSKTGKLKRIFLTDDEANFVAGLAYGKNATDFLLYRCDGKPWDRSHQQHRMKHVLKQAGIQRHIRFHDLRHTFASLLIQSGASIEVIANQLGHSGTAMAIKHYAHLSPEYIGNTVRASKPNYV